MSKDTNTDKGLNTEQDNSVLDDNLVLVGRVNSVFGVKGWVNIFSYTDPRENILDYSEWLLHASPEIMFEEKAHASSVREAMCTKVRVSDGKRHGKNIIAQLEQTADRDSASLYIGHDIYIRHSELPDLEGEVYWVQLQGLEVRNLQSQVLGKVKSLLETGAHDVLVIEPEDIQEKSEPLLIPYVEQHYVCEVNIEQKYILVDWPLEFID